MGLSIMDALKIWNCSCADTIKAYKADCDSRSLEVASSVNYIPFYNEEIVWHRTLVHLTIWGEKKTAIGVRPVTFLTLNLLCMDTLKRKVGMVLCKRDYLYSHWGFVACDKKGQAYEDISSSAASLPEHKFKFLYQHPPVQKEALGGTWVNQDPSAGFKDWVDDFSQAVSVVTWCLRQLLLA